MAGDWIKVETCLPDKPEVWQMADTLGLDPDAVIGKLIRVWGWFDQHTTDGNARGVTLALLDRISGVTGFAKAMAECGWLDEIDGGGLSLPRFDTHNGQTAKTRATTAKRVAKHKKGNAQGNGEGNAKGNAHTVTSPLANALPREEKIEKLKAPAAAVDFRADLFARWKALPDGGGGAFLSKLLKDHKPELRVLEAVERTLDEARADPKAFVQGLLRAEQRRESATDEFLARAI